MLSIVHFASIMLLLQLVSTWTWAKTQIQLSSYIIHFLKKIIKYFCNAAENPFHIFHLWFETLLRQICYNALPNLITAAFRNSNLIRMRPNVIYGTFYINNVIIITSSYTLTWAKTQIQLLSYIIQFLEK